MISNTWRTTLYLHLLHFSKKSFLHAVLARQAAGWLSLFGVRPAATQGEAPSLYAIVGGGVLAIVFLLLLGPTLNAVAPLLRLAGHLPGWVLVSVGLLLVCSWRDTVGGKILAALAAANPDAAAK